MQDADDFPVYEALSVSWHKYDGGLSKHAYVRGLHVWATRAGHPRWNIVVHEPTGPHSAKELANIFAPTEADVPRVLHQWLIENRP